jgi:hypothetical protein
MSCSLLTPRSLATSWNGWDGNYGSTTSHVFNEAGDDEDEGISIANQHRVDDRLLEDSALYDSEPPRRQPNWFEDDDVDDDE